MLPGIYELNIALKRDMSCSIATGFVVRQWNINYCFIHFGHFLKKRQTMIIITTEVILSWTLTITWLNLVSELCNMILILYWLIYVRFIKRIKITLAIMITYFISSDLVSSTKDKPWRIKHIFEKLPIVSCFVNITLLLRLSQINQNLKTFFVCFPGEYFWKWAASVALSQPLSACLMSWLVLCERH